jgi:hypothetical protein
MARMIVKKTPSRVNRPAPAAPAADTGAYGDLDNWPRSWMGFEKDLPLGEALLACFRPFIAHLASSSLSQKTIQKHVDNLWILGGEIIRDVNDDPRLRRVAADRLLKNVIHLDGGPLMYHGSEEEQQSFDSTCRKLHRFLHQPQG